MDVWLIRSVIFFIPGLMLIFFPKQVNTCQNYALKKLHTRYRIRYETRPYYYTGVCFIIISVVLSVFSLVVA